MHEPLIQVEGLSKKFCLDLKRSLWYGLRDLGSEILGKRHEGVESLRRDEFWALRDIGFHLSRGECLGLIGHNGAGKTTLLKVLNGLIKPDCGRVELRGRIGALIGLGAGFNPVLTGRENIYVNAAVLGMKRRDVDAKLEEIVNFAEIEQFLDTPVRNYSSGMNVRLGFSVAAILIEPDVLFLDEVLAVGDIGFVVKCMNAVRRMTKDAAVVFVSHNMQHIASFCSRVIVMSRGEMLVDTKSPSEGIDRYYSLVKNERQASGVGGAETLGLRLLVDGVEISEDEPRVDHGSRVSAELRLRISAQSSAAQVVLFVCDETTAPILGIPVCRRDGEMLMLEHGDHRLHLDLGQLELNSGLYSFIVSIREAESSTFLHRNQGLCPFRIVAKGRHAGKFVRPAVPLEHEHSTRTAV